MENTIYIVKNFILEGSSFGPIFITHEPNKLVKWGILIDCTFYYFIKCNGELLLSYKGPLNRQSEFIDTGLKCNLCLDEIRDNIEKVLEETKTNNISELQFKILESITKSANNPTANYFSNELYTETISDIKNINKSSCECI